MGYYNFMSIFKDKLAMSKGLKRICMNCSARFYDLDKSPIICPSCDTAFTGEIKVKSRRGRAAAEEVIPVKEAKAEKPEEEEIEDIDADDDIVSLDDVEDEDLDDDDDEASVLTIDADPDDLDDVEDDEEEDDQ